MKGMLSMKTDTLYYEDPFLCTFTATVRTCEAVENGYAVTPVSYTHLTLPTTNEV